MGTRSITQIKVDDEPILTFYRQMDGYLDGHGKQLLPLLKRRHVNGYSSQFKEYNGPANFAAMLLAELMLKHSIGTKRALSYCNSKEVSNEEDIQLACGSIYIASHNQIGDEEFNYVINFITSIEPKEPTIDVTTSYGNSAKGLTVQEFEELCENGFPEEVA